MGTPVLGNFLIGLREGLEAALVVSILVTYLVRTDRRSLIRFVNLGIAAAVVVSILMAGLIQTISDDLAANLEPVFAGTISFLAVIFVTWMIFWMKSSARTISGDLRAKLDAAAGIGSGFAVASMAFLAVSREGAETAVFFWAAAHATGSVTSSLIGLLLGLVASVLLGIAFFKSTISLNLSKFFMVTGVLLAIVAAGVGAAGIHEFQEIGWLPGEHTVVLDLARWLPEGSTQATVMAGLFNIQSETSLLQAIVWVSYLAIVLVLFLRPAKSVDPVAASSAARAASEDELTVS